MLAAAPSHLYAKARHGSLKFEPTAWEPPGTARERLGYFTRILYIFYKYFIDILNVRI